MTKTAQQLHSDLDTMVTVRSTDQLVRDYMIGSRLARTVTGDVNEGASWVVVLVAIETELNTRGIETCAICGWPNGDHDPELCFDA